MEANKLKKNNLPYIIKNKGGKLNELEKESQKTTNKFNSKIGELEKQLKSTNDILNKIKSLKNSFDKINAMNLKEGEKLMKIKQINESINKISEYKIEKSDSIIILPKPKEPFQPYYIDEMMIWGYDHYYEIESIVSFRIPKFFKNKYNDENKIQNNSKKADKCINFISSDQNINFSIPCWG